MHRQMTYKVVTSPLSEVMRLLCVVAWVRCWSQVLTFINPHKGCWWGFGWYGLGWEWQAVRIFEISYLDFRK